MKLEIEFDTQKMASNIYTFMDNLFVFFITSIIVLIPITVISGFIACIYHEVNYTSVWWIAWVYGFGTLIVLIIIITDLIVIGLTLEKIFNWFKEQDRLYKAREYDTSTGAIVSKELSSTFDEDDFDYTLRYPKDVLKQKLPSDECSECNHKRSEYNYNNGETCAHENNDYTYTCEGFKE